MLETRAKRGDFADSDANFFSVFAGELNNMRRFGFIFLLFATCCVLNGCRAASDKAAPMSAKDEARYAAAIEASKGQGYEIIGDGEMLTTDAHTGKLVVRRAPEAPSASETGETDRDAARIGAGAQDVATSDGGRSFDVAESVYAAFFEQSPAVVLSRFALEPIQDGTNLLGYRIAEIRALPESIDLKTGDIIVGIDGKIPKTPDAYFEAWQRAKAAGSCVVNVQRDMTRFDLRWQARRTQE